MSIEIKCLDAAILALYRPTRWPCSRCPIEHGLTDGLAEGIERELIRHGREIKNEKGKIKNFVPFVSFVVNSYGQI